MDFTILINRDNRLPFDYVPSDLVITDQNENNFHNFLDPTFKPMISSFVLPYFLTMQQDAKKVGFHIIVDSGYRSYYYQQMVWDHSILENGVEKTKELVAPPGASEHQSGFAIDIAYIIDEKYTDCVTDKQNETKWMMENAHKYGFILRYPKGKEDITGYRYEPWHYRFVGIELAGKLFREKITLEEYYKKGKVKKIDKLKD